MRRGKHRMRNALLAVWAGTLFAQGAAAALPELLYVTEGNRLRRYDLDTLDRRPLLEEIVVQNAASDPNAGRDVNGTVCLVPGAGGLLVMGEDTAQPHPPAGWGAFTGAGDQVGKLAAPAAVERPDPHGCGFDRRGRLFTTETGAPGFFSASGQLIEWFPPYNVYPGARGAYPKTDATSTNYCKLATDLGTPLGVAVDGRDRVYVAAASGREILRFSPPFPTGPTATGGCGAVDELGAPLADSVQRERFTGALWGEGLITYSGLAFAANGNLYAASVATGRIGEFDPDGEFVRLVLDPGDRFPPYATGTPLGLAVDAAGSLYYTDLDLEWGFFSATPGPDGKVWRIRFDREGTPQPPEIVSRGLEFPDGLAVVTGDLEEIADWPGSTVRAVPRQPDAAPEAPLSGPALVIFGVIVAICGAALVLALRRRRPTRR